MDYQFNPANILIGFAMLQGFVFGGLLCWRSRFNEANKYLGITVLFLSFYLLWVLKYDYGIQKQFQYLQFLPVLFLWGIGPAFYAYLRFLFGRPIPPKLLKWHFSPLVLEWLYFNSCTLIFGLNDWNPNNLNAFENIWVYNIFTIEHAVGLTSIAFYLVKCFHLLLQQELLPSAGKIRAILLCFTFLWIIWVPYSIFDVLYYNFAFPPSEFYAFYLLFAGLTYCIGFLGFKLKPANVLAEKAEIKMERKGVSAVLMNQEMIDLAQQMEHIMKNEKYYLDPTLNLRDFAECVGVHPNKVSAIVNMVIGQSFRDFVNTYRIEEFKSKLQSDAIAERTILSLAYEAGFNSKASFNRIFRKQVGLSPIEYLEKQKNLTQNV